MVKEIDLKSIGLCRQGVKSPRCRSGKFNFQDIRRMIPDPGNRGTERERERIKGKGGRGRQKDVEAGRGPWGDMREDMCIAAAGEREDMGR